MSISVVDSYAIYVPGPHRAKIKNIMYAKIVEKKVLMVVQRALVTSMLGGKSQIRA